MMNFNYNFDTKQMVECDIDALDDDQLISFLPVYPELEGGGPARGLFRVLRLMGKPRLEAYAEVLMMAVGKAPAAPPSATQP